MIMIPWLRGPESRCTLWAVAAISAFLFFSFSIDPLPVRTGEYKQNNDGEQSTTNEGDNVPHTQSADDRIATYTLWLAIFTAVLSISTIALFVVTWRASGHQSEDMANVLKVAREQADAAANQARIATEQHAALREKARETAAIGAATKAANDLTSRIFFAEQRPWVNIQDISISPTATKGEWEFDVVVSNTGGSPPIMCELAF